MIEIYFTVKTIGMIVGIVIMVGYTLFMIWRLHK